MGVYSPMGLNIFSKCLIEGLREASNPGDNGTEEEYWDLLAILVEKMTIRPKYDSNGYFLSKNAFYHLNKV